MKKIRNFSILVLALSVIMGGVAFAYTDNYHVKISPGAKGDLIFYPFYAAYSNWETTIEVINTSNVYSAVAKFVVRSMVDSVECRDFLIYLTPNDVWKGKLMLAQGPMVDSDTGAAIAAGELIVTSTDDSVLRRFPSGANCAVTVSDFASPENPFVTRIGEPVCKNDTCRIGYVEIIEAISYSRTVLGAAATGPIAKPVLFNRYWPAGMEGCPLSVGPDIPDADLPLNTAIDRDVPRNILYGKQVFTAPDLKLNTSVNATVLRDYSNTAGLNISVETRIGEGSYNTIGEVEAALSKNDLAMQYANSQLSIHMLTMPTRLPMLNSVDPAKCTVLNYRGNYIKDMDPERDRYFPYSIADYNLKEETVAGTGAIVSPIQSGPGPQQLGGEVNIRMGFAFEEGWTRYAFWNIPTMAPEFTDIDQGYDDDGLRDDASYTGAPIIGTVLHFTDNGYTHEAGYTPGQFFTAINGGGEEIEFYQYADVDVSLTTGVPGTFSGKVNVVLDSHTDAQND